MVDGVVMCEKDYAELVATWPCVGCGKEIPTGDRTDIYYVLSAPPDAPDHVCCCFFGDLDNFKYRVYWCIVL